MRKYESLTVRTDAFRNKTNIDNLYIQFYGTAVKEMYQCIRVSYCHITASTPRSPVRIRIVSSIEETNILPSPIFPVLQLSRIISMICSN